MKRLREEEEKDIVDVLRAKQNLNDNHVLYILNLFIDSMFGNEACIAIIDSVFTALYMKKKRTAKETDVVIERRRRSMAVYFDRSDYSVDNRVINNIKRHKSVTVIPIHTNNHWSLLVYFNDHRQFYHFDSFDHCHHDYVIDVIDKLVTDKIIVDVHNTKITVLDSTPQVDSYECGQFVAMFLYAFLKVIQNENNNRPVRRGTKLCICIDDIVHFNEVLQEYVSTRCKEANRMNFINILITQIHEKRGY